VEGSPLSEEVQTSLSKLRHLIDPQELADAHAELEQEAQLKDLVDSLCLMISMVPLRQNTGYPSWKWSRS